MITVTADLKTGYGKPYLPNPKQSAFHAAPHKYRLFVGGLGAGKSTAGAVETVLHALRYPNSRNLVARNSMGDLRKTSWKVIRGTLTNLDPRLIVSELESNISLQFVLANGSEIFGAHLQDPMSFGSLDVSTAWLDECTENDDSEAFDMLAGRIGRWPVGGPEGGRMWLSGTPNGRDWVHRAFVLDPADNYFHVVSPTSENIANLPEGYVEDLYHRFGKERADMMLNASWETIEGRVFPEFDRRVHVISDERFWRQLPKAWPKYRSIDPGIARTHPCGVNWGTVDHAGNVFIYDCFRQSDLVIEEIVKAVLLKTGSDEIRWTVIDPSSQNRNDQTGFSRFDAYSRAGIKALRLGCNDIEAGIERIRSLLWEDPDHEHPITGKKGAPRLYIRGGVCNSLIEELERYHWPKAGAFKAYTSAVKPVPRDNDLVDSLKYLLLESPAGAVEEVKPISDFWREILNLPSSPRRNLRSMIGTSPRL